MNSISSFLKSFFSVRRQHALNMFVSIFFVTFLMIIINFIITLHEYRIDVTTSKNFTLAPQTKAILSSLNTEVNIIGFFKSQSPESNIFLNLVDSFSYYSKKVKSKVIDPDKSPTITKQYGIKNYNTVVIEHLNKSQKTMNITESSFISIIKGLLSDKEKTICFSQGHGEPSISSNERNDFLAASTALITESYITMPLFLLKEESIPAACNILVIAGPEKDFLPNEIKLVSNYIKKGGGTLILLEPKLNKNLTIMLRDFNIAVRNDIIVDKISKLYGGDYTVPVVTAYGKHEITKNFNLPTFFPIARSLGQIEESNEIIFTPLFHSSSESWGETEIKDEKLILRFDKNIDYPGPVTIAVALENKKHSSPLKLVVFGDSSFANNNHFSLSGNGDLFLNTINWLSGNEELISIRPKTSTITPLLLTRGQGIFIWSAYLLLLSLVIVIGTWVFIYRRKL